MSTQNGDKILRTLEALQKSAEKKAMRKNDPERLLIIQACIAIHKGHRDFFLSLEEAEWVARNTHLPKSAVENNGDGTTNDELYSCIRKELYHYRKQRENQLGSTGRLLGTSGNNHKKFKRPVPYKNGNFYTTALTRDIC